MRASDSDGTQACLKLKHTSTALTLGLQMYLCAATSQDAQCGYEEGRRKVETDCKGATFAPKLAE